MNLHLPSLPWAELKGRIRGMFNLNDPRWGRGDDKQSDSNRPDKPEGNGNGRGPNQGPPDLDELWRDFNRKLGGLFGKGRRGDNGGGFGGGGGNFQPDMKSAGIGAGLVAAVVVLIWLGTGFFIVQEGQQAVITQFGRYKSTVGAGFNWRLPYPIQRHELVFVTQIRSVDVGRDNVIKATGLRESADAHRRREHRRNQVRGAVPPERRARLPVREQEPRAKPWCRPPRRRCAKSWARCAWIRPWPRSATRSRRACAR